MAITTYRPTTDVFGPLMSDFFGQGRGLGSRVSEMLRTPNADVVETEQSIQVMIELPGIKAENVNVDLENNILTISGEKHEERTEGDEGDTWHLSERRYGKFTRSFVLPRDVEQDRIKARFADGVLNVTIPKSEKARRRRIEIQNGDGQKQVEASAGGSK